MNYVLRSAKVYGYSQKQRAAKPVTSVQLTVVLQSETADCLNDPHTVLLFPYLYYLEQQGIYLKETLSGFEPESPVRFRTWN
jgi:hypothetical protein